MSEELTLHQILGDGCRIDGYEGAVSSVTPFVNESGHHLLSRSTLTVDEDGCIPVGHRIDQSQDLLEARTRPYERGSSVPRSIFQLGS